MAWLCHHVGSLMFFFREIAIGCCFHRPQQLAMPLLDFPLLVILFLRVLSLPLAEKIIAIACGGGVRPRGLTLTWKNAQPSDWASQLKIFAQSQGTKSPLSGQSIDHCSLLNRELEAHKIASIL